MDARRRLNSSSLGVAWSAWTVVRITLLMVLPPLATACAFMPDVEPASITRLQPALDKVSVVAAAAQPAPNPEAPLPASNTASSTERPYWTHPPAPARRNSSRSKPDSSQTRLAASTDGVGLPASPENTPTGRLFAYEADRVYEVSTAPLRVTVVTLAPGETVLSRAAGDTLRWQIAETRSGSGATERVHVLLKPLERGLTTNVVLATSGRLYLLALRSGASDAFDQTVSWTYPPERSPESKISPLTDGRYRIIPMGRAPRWMPLAILTDGVRTQIIFPDSISSGEAPVLIGRLPNGSPRLLSYRQVGNLYLVDEVIQDAELRLGDHQPKVVRIRRLPGASR